MRPPLSFACQLLLRNRSRSRSRSYSRSQSRNFYRNLPRDHSSSSRSTFKFTTANYPISAEVQKHRLETPKDVQLKVGEKIFEAHREVLSDSSPKLKAMLSEVWDPEKNRVCELDQEFVNPDVVTDLLKVFYTGKVVITKENAQMLFMAASYLDIPLLQEAAKDFLNQKLQPSAVDVLEWFRFSVMFELKTLAKRCKKLICFSCDTVFKDEKLLAVSLEYLRQLFTNLNDDWSNMMVNEEMVRLLIRWVNHEPTTRSDSLNTLFAIFPLLELSENFLRHISEDELIKSSNCLELVNKALDELSLESQNAGSSESETPETSLNDVYCLDYCCGTPLIPMPHLDVSTEQSNKMPHMMYKRKRFCVATVGNKIYCFGGETCYRNDNIHQTNVTQVFDTERNRWTQLQSMPGDRQNSSAVAHNGFIYVSGGVYITENCGDGTSNVYRYSIATNEWKSVAPMFEQRYIHKLVLLKDSIYAIGGKLNGSIEKYDVETDKWEIIGKFEILRRPHEATVHQDKIYAFGKRQMFAYDPELNTTEIREIRGSIEIQVPSVVSIGDKIWAIKHFNFSHDDRRELVEYDLATNEWKELGISIHAFGKPVVIKR